MAVVARAVPMASIQQRIHDDVSRFGWHVVKVLGDEDFPAFAYTVGLTVTYEHPEVIVFGIGDDLDLMHHLLAVIQRRVEKGEAFHHGARKTGILPGVSCHFARFPTSAYEEHLGQAVRHLGGERSFSVVQCIWPDKKRRLPWDPKVDLGLLARQPVFLRPDAGPRDPKWPFPEPHSRRALTTKQVVRGEEPVRFAGRFDDGSYQLVCETTDDEDDLVWVTLGWLLDHDPSLRAVASLDLGEAKVRKEPGKPFRRVSPAEDDG